MEEGHNVRLSYGLSSFHSSRLMDMDIYTFIVFMYYDDIMNFITPVCGYKIDSMAIPCRISPRNQGKARKMP